jgi:hypothetical protein
MAPSVVLPDSKSYLREKTQGPRPYGRGYGHWHISVVIFIGKKYGGNKQNGGTVRAALNQCTINVYYVWYVCVCVRACMRVCV